MLMLGAVIPSPGRHREKTGVRWQAARPPLPQHANAEMPVHVGRNRTVSQLYPQHYTQGACDNPSQPAHPEKKFEKAVALRATIVSSDKEQPKTLGAVRPVARVHAPQPLWVDEAASSLGVAQAEGVKPALPQEGAQLMHGCLAQCQPLWGSSGL